MKSLFISILVLMLTACSITPTSETTEENQQQEPIETEQETKENESKNEPESPAPNYENQEMFLPQLITLFKATNEAKLFRN